MSSTTEAVRHQPKQKKWTVEKIAKPADLERINTRNIGFNQRKKISRGNKTLPTAQDHELDRMSKMESQLIKDIRDIEAILEKRSNSPQSVNYQQGLIFEQGFS